MSKQIEIPQLSYALQADWHDGQSSDQIILTFVGFGSSKKSNHDFAAKLVEMTGASALVIDLSGHGESPFDINETTPAQHLLEATKAYDWLKQNYPDSNVYVMGTSYGGFIAAYLTRFREVSKLVLRTPAIYEPSMFYTMHQDIDKLLVREYRRDSEQLKRHSLFLQSPIITPSTLLVIHGNDASIPTQTTDVYGEEFSATSYTAKGFVHAFRDPSNPKDNIDEYFSTIANFITL